PHSYSVLHHCVFFFFSSRRRHTRSKRDWSSDVCSSDLIYSHNQELSRQKRLEQANKELLTSLSHDVRTPLTSLLGYLDALESDRSEERRVGKECKSRWARCASKKKEIKTESRWRDR